MAMLPKPTRGAWLQLAVKGLVLFVLLAGARFQREDGHPWGGLGLRGNCVCDGLRVATATAAFGDRYSTVG